MRWPKFLPLLLKISGWVDDTYWSTTCHMVVMDGKVSHSKWPLIGTLFSGYLTSIASMIIICFYPFQIQCIQYYIIQHWE